MTLTLANLPDDTASLKTMVVALQDEVTRLTAQNERLDHILSVLRA